MLRRLEALAIERRAPVASSAGAKCEAKAYGSPSSAASWAPNRLEPENPHRHVEARSRDRPHALARLGGTEVAHQLDNVLRKAVGACVKIAPERASR